MPIRGWPIFSSPQRVVHGYRWEDFGWIVRAAYMHVPSMVQTDEMWHSLILGIRRNVKP